MTLPGRNSTRYSFDPNGGPTVNTLQLIELDAPEDPADVDLVIVVANGQTGACGNFGNEAGDPMPVLGSRLNTTTMRGTVQ